MIMQTWKPSPPVYKESELVSSSSNHKHMLEFTYWIVLWLQLLLLVMPVPSLSSLLEESHCLIASAVSVVQVLVHVVYFLQAVSWFLSVALAPDHVPLVIGCILISFPPKTDWLDHVPRMTFKYSSDTKITSTYCL